MLEVDWRTAICEQLSVDRVLEITRRIAGSVRLSGSQEELAAAEEVRDLLREAGLRTELTFHDAYISLPGPAALLTPEGERLPCITHSFSAATESDGIEADLVDLGDALTAAPDGARGRIVLMDGLAMPGKVQVVEAGGAAGQIYVNADLTHEMIVSTVWGSPGTAERDRYPKAPVVSVTRDVGGRLRERLQRGHRRLRIVCEVDTCWRKTPLLVADLDGRHSQDFVLFSGHLDSWHLGAMDNAAANATMVEAARVFAANPDRLYRGLRLAFWSGHSHGRYSGSAWYADNHWRELRGRCVAHVNVDSIGGRGATVLSEGVAMASTRALGAEAIRTVAGEEFPGSRVGRAGDQSFVALGIPSLWMSLSEQPPTGDPMATAFASIVGSPRSGGLGWWWHTTEDTVDKLDRDVLQRDGRIYLRAVGRLLAEPLLPLSVAAEATEVRDVAADLARAAAERLDLSTLVSLTEDATDVAARLELWRDRRADGPVTGEVAGVFNRGVNALLRGLVGPLYSRSGPFAQDPTASVPPLPLLDPVRRLVTLPPDSEDACTLTVDLVRARNRVEDSLLRGLEAARMTLELLP